MNAAEERGSQEGVWEQEKQRKFHVKVKKWKETNLIMRSNIFWVSRLYADKTAFIEVVGLIVEKIQCDSLVSPNKCMILFLFVVCISDITLTFKLIDSSCWRNFCFMDITSRVPFGWNFDASVWLVEVYFMAGWWEILQVQNLVEMHNSLKENSVPWAPVWPDRFIRLVIVSATCT